MPTVRKGLPILRQSYNFFSSLDMLHVISFTNNYFSFRRNFLSTDNFNNNKNSAVVGYWHANQDFVLQPRQNVNISIKSLSRVT